MFKEINIIPSRVWVHQGNGATASVYGASPWTNEQDKHYWLILHRGYTWECIGTDGSIRIGLGRNPVATKAEAETIRDIVLAL